MTYAADGRFIGQGLVQGLMLAVKIPTEEAFDFQAQICALALAVPTRRGISSSHALLEAVIITRPRHAEPDGFTDIH